MQPLPRLIFIRQAARVYGSQCVTIAVDAKREEMATKFITKWAFKFRWLISSGAAKILGAVN
jgi:imidazole glycerol phosphate synthase subunit HisF